MKKRNNERKEEKRLTMVKVIAALDSDEHATCGDTGQTPPRGGWAGSYGRERKLIS